MKMSRRFLIAIFLFLIAFVLCQNNKIDIIKSQKFQQYKKKVYSSSSNLEENALRLLENAQTNYEKTIAYFSLGGDFYRKGEYRNAVFYLEKAEAYGKDLDSLKLQTDYNILLVMAYRRAGLQDRSNEAWDRAIALSNKTNDPYKEANYYYSLSKIYDIDEEFCKAAEARHKFLGLVPHNIQQQDPDYFFAVYVQTAYSEIKCGHFEAARKSIADADKITTASSDKTKYTLYEMYELVKALDYLENKDTEKAKKSFDLAYQSSKSKATNSVTKLILSERIDADIDKPEELLKYSKEVKNLTILETQLSKELVNYEFAKSKTAYNNQKDRLMFWILGSLLVFIVLGVITYIGVRRNRKLKLSYYAILEDIEKRNQQNADKLEKNETKLQLDNKDNKEIENEKEIVKALENLEAKIFFKNKNLSATQVAVLLKITPRNLSYILKKYRNEDFYNYMNNVRIDYITKALREKPKLLSYKIAVLADMCGYSSHSQFATSFKTKTGISPSQYIEFLQKEKQNRKSDN